MKRLLLLWLIFAGTALGSGKDYVPGFTLVNAVTMGADITSGYVDTRGWDNVDFELVATGTPTGSFYVDCSLNNPVFVASPVWVALGISPTPGVTGSASNVLIEINQTGCPFMRLRYVRSSSTGTLTAYASEKQL